MRATGDGDLLVLVSLLHAASLCGAAPAAGLDSIDDAEQEALVRDGTDLDEGGALELEEIVRREPGDARARLQLLGYHARHPAAPGVRAPPRHPHVLWVVENHPDSAAAGLPEVRLGRKADGEGYARVGRQWRQHLEKRGTEARIVGNAGLFFEQDEEDLAEELLGRAKELDQADPRWPRELGHLLALRLEKAKPEDVKDLADRVIREFGEAAALEGRPDPPEVGMISPAAYAALEGGDLLKAEAYGIVMIRYPFEEFHPFLAGARHHGNLIRGRIALKRGDVDSAGRYLLAAGRIPGNGPELTSFGPNMTLAKELLEHERRDVVLSYLGLCANFWKLEDGRLSRWSEAVRRGEIPDFGANLLYQD